MENAVFVTRGQHAVIQPAFDTPQTTLYLTEMDLIAPGYIPCLCVYENDNSRTNDPTTVLKAALAKTLVLYYPLAGRLKETGDHGRLEVHCNSQGVHFTEAYANCTLSEVSFLKDPYNPSADSPLFPRMDLTRCLDQIPFLSIQVTKFTCGGFVVGFMTSHMVMDGSGFYQFIQHFAEMAKGNSLSTFPVWERNYLAPREPPRIDDNLTHGRPRLMLERPGSRKSMQHTTLNIPEDVVGRLKVSIVRESNGRLSYCSTFEALVAFVWEVYAETMRFSEDYIGFHILVNGRKALENVVSKGYYGNCIVSMDVLKEQEEDGASRSCDVVRALRSAKGAVDEEYMRTWIDILGEQRRKEKRIPAIMLTDKVLFNDWSRFDWTPDFGVGKGLRASIPLESICPMHPFVLFLPKERDVEGFDVWIALPKEILPTFKICFEKSVNSFIMRGEHLRELNASSPCCESSCGTQYKTGSSINGKMCMTGMDVDGENGCHCSC